MRLMASDAPLLTIVIPAYQEERRIGPTLDELGRYLATTSFGDVEVIVVSAGSTDATVTIAQQYESKLAAKLTVLDLPGPRGKGAAVRAGMLAAQGKYVLFTDADLAYQPELFGDFVSRLESGADIVIAQRTDTTRYAWLARRWMTMASRFVFETFITPGIADTQAGLKAFTQKAAKDVFSRQKIDGLIFDVEILVLARRSKYRVEKAFVSWQDKSGSRIRVARDSVRAALDLVKFFWRLGSGEYDR
jgi:dolichyl-phosphate beta-glucosyltransferase